MTTTTESLPAAWIALEDRESPWNVLAEGMGIMGAGQGGTVDHLLTAEEVLKATNLDIHIKKYPFYIDTNFHSNKPTFLRTEKWYITGYEPPTGDLVTFAPVSDKYEVVQPVEALSVFDEVVGGLPGAWYSAAFNLPEKSMMGVVIQMPEKLVVDPQGANDVISLNLLGINSFDGSTSLMGRPMPERLYCTNQVPALRRHVRSNGFCLKHNKNVKARAADARRMIAATQDYFKTWGELAQGLFEKPMTDDQFMRFIKKLDEFALDGSESDLQKARIEERRTEIFQAWKAEHNANISGTRWGALNVVTEFAQWGRRVNGSPRTGTDKRRQRAIGTLVHPTVDGLGRNALEILAA